MELIMKYKQKNHYRIFALVLAFMLICVRSSACKDAKISEEKTSAPNAVETEISDDETAKTDADETDAEAEDAKAKDEVKNKPAPEKTSDKKSPASASAKTETPAKSKTSSSEKSSAPDKKSKKKSKPKTKSVKSTDITVTFFVDCKLLYEEDPELANLVSDKGVMIEGESVKVKKGASVLDVLRASGVKYAGSTYISSIGGLSEKDGGSESGWCYSVNGKFPSLGVTKYKVKDGDKVAFRYSLNNGLEFGV
jgi:hypothetical protein